MEWLVVLVAVAPFLAIFIGIALGRMATDGDWDEHYRCKDCSHTSRWNGSFSHPYCQGCGEKTDRQVVIRRATFPFGWEEKP